MKKIYSLAAAVALCASASAQQPHETINGSFHKLIPAQRTTSVANKAPQKAAPQKAQMIGMPIGYADAPAGAYGINNGKQGMAVRFPQSYIAKYKGNQITSLNIGTPVNSQLSNPSAGKYVNSLNECTIYISESVGGDPICETKATLGDEAFIYETCQLSTPYTITGETDVVINVMYDNVGDNDYPIITDDSYNVTDDQGYLYSRFKEVDSKGYILLQDEYEWKTWAKYGGAFCLTANMIGDNMPVHTASISEIIPPSLIKPGEAFNLQVEVQNAGADALEEVTLDIKIADQPTQTVTLPVSRADGAPGYVAYNDYGIVSTQVTCPTEGYNTYSISMPKVNGETNNKGTTAATGKFLAMEYGFPINVVAEELTSTTCSACPLGLTGMEMTKEKYGDRFIPIGVHCPIPSTGDPMTITSFADGYANLWSDLRAANPGGLSAPSAYLMRNLTNSVYPHPVVLQYYVGQMLDNMSNFDVKAAITPTDDSNIVTLNIEVTSSIDAEGSWGIAYTITEDNVGPYVQTNGYSGSGDNYGWGSKPVYAATIYNDVARRGSLNNPEAAGSFTTLEKGGTFKYDKPIKINYVKDHNAYRVAIMLVDKNTKAIVNATEVKSPTYTGINTVNADNAQAVAEGLTGSIRMNYPGQIYTIDGRLVATAQAGTIQVPAGLYIVATSNGAVKIAVR